MGQTPIDCSVMRGGTSKGLYFLASDLPADRAVRDAVLLAAMGSPDPREIDGMGGGHPLTSKVAVVKESERADADVDYLFLQVWPDRAEVSDNQNCGNLLAGVGPFRASTTGWSKADDDVTDVRIWMENTQSLAVAHVETPGGETRYDGDGARSTACQARTRPSRSTSWTSPGRPAARCSRRATPSTPSPAYASPASTTECPSSASTPPTLA